MAIVQDPRRLPAAMVDSIEDTAGVTLPVCLVATTQFSAEDFETCFAEVAEVHTRIQTQALEALPSAVQEQLADLQA